MDYSAKLTLPYILPNQAQKHVTMNESLRRLDALVQISVISMVETEPPADPTEGDRYVVADGGTGVWDRADGQLAAFQDGAWELYSPQTGWLAWDEAKAALTIFDGVDWRHVAQSSQPTFGVNATADDFNRLAVRAPASLFDHEGGGHQLKINKAGEDETASVLFQSNYSGRAEVGLVGNNDVGIKVSSDGQEFYELMRICGKTKRVGIGVSEPKAKLHVSGVLKLSPQPRDGLPDPSSVGAGCIVYVGPQENDTGYFAFSDGNSWTSMPIH